MKTILFVDDQELLAKLSCNILLSHGYLAECAYNGRDAVEMFRHGKFDMLITDFRMDGMNGLELARLVRQITPGVPVIIVSGYSPVEGSGEVNEWLQKEELFPALLDKVRQYIGEPTVEEIVHSA